METLAAFLMLFSLMGLGAGTVMALAKPLRPKAPNTLSAASGLFLLSGLAKDGLSGLFTALFLVTIITFIVGIFGLLVPSLRHSSRSLVLSSIGISLASIVGMTMFTNPNTAQEQKPTTSLDHTQIPKTPNSAATPQPETAPTPQEPLTTAALSSIPPPQTMYVDATRLNVRNGPSKSHKVIWTLKNNEKVSVTKTENGWAHITSPKYTGWVFATYLTPKPEIPTRTPPATAHTALSKSKIAKILIERFHAYYPGNCPCPYNRARNGSRCGKRSAYSRPGGASPLCYESDVTDQMIADYRARN